MCIPGDKHILACERKDTERSDAFQKGENLKPAADGKGAAVPQWCVAPVSCCRFHLLLLPV